MTIFKKDMTVRDDVERDLEAAFSTIEELEKKILDLEREVLILETYKTKCEKVLAIVKEVLPHEN